MKIEENKCKEAIKEFLSRIAYAKWKDDPDLLSIDARFSRAQSFNNPLALGTKWFEGLAATLDEQGKCDESAPSEPFRITSSGWYKSRDGRKVFVIGEDKYQDGTPFFWMRLPWNDSDPYRVQPNGRRSDSMNDPLDLVAEWTEPVTKEVIVYLCRDKDGDVGTYTLGGTAKELAPCIEKDAIASARVTLVEGKFCE